MKKIKLTQGKFAIVDNEDFEWLNQWKWCCDANGYAVRHEQKSEYGNNSRKMVKMHKFILKTPKGMMTDHINRNCLDNRKENLRIVDNHMNQRNSKISVKNKSGFKGVYWDKKYKRWCARATLFGKRIFGGGFFNKRDASLAYERIITIYG
jgi:hypothetical protein